MEKIFDNIIRDYEHNVKFLIDIYLNIARTSLSVGGKGIKEMLTNKYEMQYYNPETHPVQPGGAIAKIKGR